MAQQWPHMDPQGCWCPCRDHLTKQADFSPANKSRAVPWGLPCFPVRAMRSPHIYTRLTDNSADFRLRRSFIEWQINQQLKRLTIEDSSCISLFFLLLESTSKLLAGASAPPTGLLRPTSRAYNNFSPHGSLMRDETWQDINSLTFFFTCASQQQIAVLTINKTSMPASSHKLSRIFPWMEQ